MASLAPEYHILRWFSARVGNLLQVKSQFKKLEKHLHSAATELFLQLKTTLCVNTDISFD